MPILLKKAKLSINKNMLHEINFSKTNKRAQLAFGIPGSIFAGTTFYTGAYSVGSAISYTDPFLKEALIATAFSAISATGLLIISTKFKRKRFSNTKNTIELFNSID